MIKLIGLILSINAYAATTDVIYITKGGSQVSAQDAILQAAKGDLVYKCQPQEFKVSKSGTSISVKNKKKKLTKEEILSQIEDLKKRGE